MDVSDQNFAVNGEGKTMKKGLTIGSRVEHVVRVEKNMRPAMDGGVIHNVMSTMSMIYFMEYVGRKLIRPYLEETEEGMGVAVDVRHLGMAIVGEKVTFSAVCTEMTENRIICSVTAYTNHRLIGKGKFIQVILPKKGFMSKRKTI